MAGNQMDIDAVIDLAFVSGRVQRDLANHVRQEILRGLTAQWFRILGNCAQNPLDFDLR